MRKKRALQKRLDDRLVSVPLPSFPLTEVRQEGARFCRWDEVTPGPVPSTAVQSMLLHLVTPGSGVQTAATDA